MRRDASASHRHPCLNDRLSKNAHNSQTCSVGDRKEDLAFASSPRASSRPISCCRHGHSSHNRFFARPMRCAGLGPRGCRFPSHHSKSSSIDHIRPPVDADTIGQFAPFFQRSTTATQQRLPGRDFLMDPIVNRLPRQPAIGCVWKVALHPTRNLIRRPTLFQFLLNDRCTH